MCIVHGPSFSLTLLGVRRHEQGQDDESEQEHREELFTYHSLLLQF